MDGSAEACGGGETKDAMRGVIDLNVWTCVGDVIRNLNYLGVSMWRTVFGGHIGRIRNCTRPTNCAVTQLYMFQRVIKWLVKRLIVCESICKVITCMTTCDQCCWLDAPYFHTYQIYQRPFRHKSLRPVWIISNFTRTCLRSNVWSLSRTDGR